MEVPHVSRRHRVLHRLVPEKHAAVDHKDRQPQLAPQLPAQHLDDGSISAVAVQHGDLFKAVAEKPPADILQHMVKGIRL